MFAGPKLDGVSLPISTLEPMGRETCMMLSSSSSGTSKSSGPLAKVSMNANSPPNTER